MTRRSSIVRHYRPAELARLFDICRYLPPTPPPSVALMECMPEELAPVIDGWTPERYDEAERLIWRNRRIDRHVFRGRLPQDPAALEAFMATQPGWTICRAGQWEHPLAALRIRPDENDLVLIVRSRAALTVWNERYPGSAMPLPPPDPE